MSEMVAGAPVPRSPIARLIGVVSSPKETFDEIVAHPAWIPPVVCYLVVFFLSLGVFGAKADWDAIDMARIQSLGLAKLMPEEQLEAQVAKQNERLSKMSSVQVGIAKAMENGSGTMIGFHGATLFYSTLFVFVGALQSMKLGRAWLNFLLCILVYVCFGAVSWTANFAFGDSPAASLLLAGTAMILMMGIWIWLLNSAASRDADLHRMLAVCTHASVVMMLSSLVMLAISIASQETLQVPPEGLVKSYLGAYVDSGAPALQKILNSLDLFTLWWLGVMAIGFRAATKLSTGVAASVTFLPWAVIVLIKVAWAAVFG